MYCRIYFLYTVSLILFFTTPPVVGDINIINKKYFKYLLVSYEADEHGSRSDIRVPGDEMGLNRRVVHFVQHSPVSGKGLGEMGFYPGTHLPDPLDHQLK